MRRVFSVTSSRAKTTGLVGIGTPTYAEVAVTVPLIFLLEEG